MKHKEENISFSASRYYLVFLQWLEELPKFWDPLERGKKEMRKIKSLVMPLSHRINKAPDQPYLQDSYNVKYF